MCGKFTANYTWRQVHDYSNLLPSEKAGPIDTATPMRFASVIHLDTQGRRAVLPMRWGFAGRSAKSPAERPKHMHARSETIDKLPAFAVAFAHSRGIVAVETFNEGEELPNAKTKQWTIIPRDGKPIGIAVVFERWTHPDGGELLTFVMATAPANMLISRITDRMPAILPPGSWAEWLGETNAPLSEVKTLLQTFEGDWDMQPQQTAAKTAVPPEPNPQSRLL
jgi:putative SOS response-associated peptidase YedK